MVTKVSSDRKSTDTGLKKRQEIKGRAERARVTSVNCMSGPSECKCHLNSRVMMHHDKRQITFQLKKKKTSEDLVAIKILF